MVKLGIYKHKRCTDSAILVLNRYWIPETASYKLKVQWVWLSNGKQHLSGINDNIVIKQADVPNWEELHDET
jgi:hypothetical protein